MCLGSTRPLKKKMFQCSRSILLISDCRKIVSFQNHRLSIIHRCYSIFSGKSSRSCRSNQFIRSKQRNFASYKRNSWTLADNLVKIYRSIWVLPFSMAIYTGYKHYMEHLEHQSTLVTIEDLDKLPPVELPKDPEKIKELAGKRKVKLRGIFDHDNEFFLAQRINQHISDNILVSSFDRTAYYVLTPMILEDGRRVLVNRGWVSKFKKDPERRKLGQVQGTVELNAYVQTDEQLDILTQFRTFVFKKIYLPRSENSDNLFDMETLSKKLDVDPVAVFVADRESSQKMGPIGGQINFDSDLDLSKFRDTIIWLIVALLLYHL